MKKAKYMVLALVLIVAVAGAAYAAWSQAVTVNGSVTTGTLYVGLSGQNISVSDGTTNGAVTEDFAGTSGTAAASATAVTSAGNGDSLTVRLAPTTGADNGLNNKMTIDFSNLYPGYTGTINVTLTNDGTVPVSIADSSNWLTISGAPSWLTLATYFNSTLANGSGTMTVAAGGSIPVELVFTVPDNSSIPMNGSADLSATVVANQAT
jgi:predicted ribosomally synthesized peptide with SipW-like signal peptide